MDPERKPSATARIPPHRHRARFGLPCFDALMRSDSIGSIDSNGFRGFSDHGIFNLADSIDGDSDDVAFFQHLRRLHGDPYASGCSGRDQIPRL